MCSWAIIQSGIKAVYFGSYNPQYGYMLSHKFENTSYPKIYGGIEEQECDKILGEFFTRLREGK